MLNNNLQVEPTVDGTKENDSTILIAYRFASAFLILDSVFAVIRLSLGDSANIAVVVINILIAIGLLLLRNEARILTLIRAYLTIVISPITVFLNNELPIAVILTFYNWMFSASLLLVL